MNDHFRPLVNGDYNLVIPLAGMAHFCHFDVYLEGKDLQMVQHFQKIMFQCFFNNLLWRLVTSVWHGFNLNYFYFHMFRNAKDDAMEIMAIMKECGNFMADIYRIGKVFKMKSNILKVFQTFYIEYCQIWTRGREIYNLVFEGQDILIV